MGQQKASMTFARTILEVTATVMQKHHFNTFILHRCSKNHLKTTTVLSTVIYFFCMMKTLMETFFCIWFFEEPSQKLFYIAPRSVQKTLTTHWAVLTDPSTADFRFLPD